VLIRPLDREVLRESFRNAKPFPFVLIEDFLDPTFAAEVAASLPSFEKAASEGHQFQRVNESKKVQLTDPAQFSEPVRRLHEALRSPAFLEDLAAISGIPHLLADEQLRGGGVHVTGPTGRLDVHADFNLIRDRGLHRRLNLLLYLNPVWEDAWGGLVELWDREVKVCHQAIAPRLNRCVIFETSDHSFHGVTPVRTPPGVARKSFAAYYYTREAPAGWDGSFHTTVFKARPDEHLRRYVLMPAERLQKNLRRVSRAAWKRVAGTREPRGH